MPAEWPRALSGKWQSFLDRTDILLKAYVGDELIAPWENRLKILCDLDAKVDESANLGRRMFPGWMKGEEREAFSVPVRKQVDQVALRQHFSDPQPMIWAIPVPARHSSSMDFGSLKVRGPVVATSTDSSALMNSQSKGRPV